MGVESDDILYFAAVLLLRERLAYTYLEYHNKEIDTSMGEQLLSHVSLDF
jgi:hypothetical protein